jgi:DNA-binding NtrC family response regulator
MLKQIHKDTARRLEPKSKLVGSSESMRALIDQVHRVMNVTVPVFLQGESGTGKELVARTIHDAGNRAEQPFVALNCASIPEGLQENELFGHERGAFTGAAQAFPGKFEQAHRGTLFLDEVAETSPSVQARLLRVLQEGVVQRLGGTVARAVDVRVVAASHKDLDALVRSGTFRQDLYFRIVVYPIVVAPLRERRDDIPLLIMHFLRKYAGEGSGRIKAMAPEALDQFCAHSWPGNVRQLENAVRRAIIASDGDIGVRVARVILGTESDRNAHSPLVPSPDDDIVPLAELERRAIAHALHVTGGNRALAAKKLGIGRATLHRKLVRRA